MVRTRVTSFRALALSSCAALALSIGVAGSAVAEAPRDAAAATVQFQIPVQSLASALSEFARQSGRQLLFTPDVVAGKTANAVVGGLDPLAALDRLIAGSGLTYGLTASGAILLRDPMRSSAASNAPAEGPAAPREPNTPRATTQDASNGPQSPVEKVTVTGTRIRGLKGIASPSSTYSRDEIERTGSASPQDFVRRLPQNFNGGASDATVGTITGGGDLNNNSSGTGINLRGLGNGASLVLLNGRRMAAGSMDGDFVDISLIPLSAVERVDVVPDGASALYGSDAVGGVVNFILRRNFDGVEGRARYGAVTSGGRQEFQVGGTAGSTWSSGSALLSYEYSDSTPLEASDRDYTRAARSPFMLLPDSERHGVLFSMNQSVAPNWDFFVDGTYSHRATIADRATASFAQRIPADVSVYGITAGTQGNLSDTLALEVSATYSASDAHSRVDDVTLGGLTLLERETDATLFSIDAKVDGTLFRLASGPVLFAAGGQFREEDVDAKDILSARIFDPTRSVLGIFGEVYVPIVGPDGLQGGANRLELSLAARYDRYTDFGSTTNPKLGLVWRADDSIKLRGTYGKSFRAPPLAYLNPQPDFVGPFPLSDPTTGGTTNVMAIFGNGNSGLTPEKATTWTVGADFSPASVPGLVAKATYYNVDYTDRFLVPFSSVDFFNSLIQEAVLGPAIVQRSVSNSVIMDLALDPTFANFFGIDLSTVSTVVDYRRRNLAAVKTDGVDFSVAYSWASSIGEWQGGIDGTYILSFDNQITATAPIVEILDTPYNPIDLKMRVWGSLRHDDLTVSAYLNYVDSYSDTRSGSSVRVSSWTTLDLTFGYDLRSAGILEDSSILLTVVNLTDEEPPFVGNLTAGFDGIAYDGANASPLGRFIALQLTTKW